MLKQLELSKDDHQRLFEHCAKRKIEFISTPYDISADFLNKLGVQKFKTASADIVDLPLHSFLSGTGKDVIVATGMATLESEEVLGLYANKSKFRYYIAFPIITAQPRV